MEYIPICECATFWEAHHDECPVRREVESLRATIKQRCIDSSVEAQRAFLAEIDTLRAELAECKRDAERYRWIRDNHEVSAAAMWIHGNVGPREWDAAIDAALAAEGECT